MFCKFLCLGSLDFMDTRLCFGLSGVRIPEDPKYFSPTKPPDRLVFSGKGKGKSVPLQARGAQKVPGS